MLLLNFRRSVNTGDQVLILIYFAEKPGNSAFVPAARDGEIGRACIYNCNATTKTSIRFRR
jgi:hypothetical protein